MITVSVTNVIALENLKLASGKLMDELIRARTIAGRHLEKETRRTILEQIPAWQALNTKYREWKVKHGFDSRKLLRTHIMAGLIRYRVYYTSPTAVIGGVTILDRTYWPLYVMKLFKRFNRVQSTEGTVQRKGKNIFSAVKSPGKGKPISVVKVARIHEEGRGHIPKRAFFEPTAEREWTKVVIIFNEAFDRAMGPLH